MNKKSNREEIILGYCYDAIAILEKAAETIKNNRANENTGTQLEKAYQQVGAALEHFKKLDYRCETGNEKDRPPDPLENYF